MATDMDLHPSSIVRARGRRFVLMDVEEHGECRSVRLSPLHGDGAPLTLLHPYDRLELLPVAATPKTAGRRRVAWCCAAAVRASHAAGETRAAIDAHIDLLPFQLEPVLAVLHGEAARVLLADEVGLGKTIQAGLILSELRARHALRRALVLTPAGLREQWAAELRDRFQLDVEILDAGELAAAERRLPPAVNPWTVPGVAIASIDLLKRPELLPQLEFVVWDAVIVDEAHHAAPGTHRHRAAALACGRARVVVLITATPHNGDRKAFDELCSLGSAFDGMPARLFHRTREDVSVETLSRRTRLVRVARSAAECRLDAALRAYTDRVWRESAGAGAATGARLAMVVLRKRALSGPSSLARSLTRRLAALERGPSASETQLFLDFRDSLDGELIDDDCEPAPELSAPGLGDLATERATLLSLLELARSAIDADSKAGRLLSAIRKAREQAIVFTEYRDTLDDLRRRLDGAVTVALLHGGMMPPERHQAIASFEAGRARVLLATDAAAEGLNLHRRCRWVIHHEVPWSPVRIEQRNGRVDRLGQSRRVHVWHLIAADTEEHEVLAQLARRSAAAARDLDSEAAVADAVFTGADFSLKRLPRTRPRQSPRANREAARVSLLRRLPRAHPEAAAPLMERRASVRTPLIACFRLTVLSGRSRVAASECIAVRGPDLAGCRRVAVRHARRRAARSVAIDRRWSRAIDRRSDELRQALAAEDKRAVQTPLFDRRALRKSEYEQSERRRALSDVSPESGSDGKYRVLFSLIAALAPRRAR